MSISAIEYHLPIMEVGDSERLFAPPSTPRRLQECYMALARPLDVEIDTTSTMPLQSLHPWSTK